MTPRQWVEPESEPGYRAHPPAFDAGRPLMRWQGLVAAFVLCAVLDSTIYVLAVLFGVL